MSALETEDMSALETRQMSAAETGQMSAVETRQMYSIGIKTGQRHVAIVDICLVSTAEICPVSAADICPVSTADICPVPTEDIYPVSTGVLPVENNIFQTLTTNFASHGRREFCQATPTAEFKTDAATCSKSPSLSTFVGRFPTSVPVGTDLTQGEMMAGLGWPDHPI